MSKLYKICTNVDNILHKRNYIPSEECNVNPYLISNDIFQNEFYPNETDDESIDRSKLIMKYHKINEPDNVFVVYFANENNIGKPNILNYIKKIKDLESKSAFLVVKKNFNVSNKKNVISSIAENIVRGLTDVHIEVFEDNELVVNILDNYLQPKFELITKDCHEQIFQTFCCNAEQLPRMRHDNIVARLLGYRPKDIIKVTSIFETCGTSINYLYVI